MKIEDIRAKTDSELEFDMTSLKKELFEASPIAQMKVLGIPLITVAGVIFAGFLGFLLVEWMFDPHRWFD